MKPTSSSSFSARIVFACLLALLGLGSSRSFADNYSLLIEGLPGESATVAHPKEIDVIGYSLGISNIVSSVTGGSVGKATFGDLFVSKLVDVTSPALSLRCISGQSIPKVVLSVWRPEVKGDYFTITLQGVVVTRASTEGSSASGHPTETVSFNYNVIKWTYRPQKPDGTLGDPVTAGYDIKAGKVL